MPVLPANRGYTLLLLASIIVSILLWTRLARRDPRLITIYLGGLVAAFAGAKLVYFLAEGWMYWDHPQRWAILAAGKSILGALLGGYGGVEFAKKLVGYEKTTGDLFALVVPIGIIGGRIGCLIEGCCPGFPMSGSAPWMIVDAHGVTRWPAVPVEIAFNVLILAVILALRGTRRLTGQHFHLYLMGYGLFRFAHELLRATPRLGSTGLSGYQFAALAVAALGMWGFAKRRRTGSTPAP